MTDAPAAAPAPAAPAPAADGGPLLIVLHGPTGCGKTTLAATLAAEAAAQGRVEGWLQRAVGRAQAGRGAAAYDGLPLGAGTGPALRLLERDEACAPPYREAEGAASAMDAWLARLAADPRPIDLLVLDEIGGLERAGRGHAPRLPALLARAPSAVLAVANSARLEDVEALFGQRIDVRVDATAPDALQRLREVLVARRDFERVGLFGALAGALEVGAGSVVHGANIPFGGLGMVAAQAALLTRAARPLADRGRVVWIALLAAAIKSLSPAGQRLRPMLAIAMQGWLFSRALRWLGWRRGAVVAGGFAMGAWAGAQGLLMQWLLVGDALALALDTLRLQVAQRVGTEAPGLWALVGAWIGLHAGVVALAAGLAWGRGAGAAPAVATGEDEAALPRWTPPLALGARRGWGASVLHALRELARPAFWLPLGLVLAALAWAGQPDEALVWVALRALLVAWVLFVLVQRLDLAALPGGLRRLGLWGPAIAWRRALARLRDAREASPSSPSPRAPSEREPPAR